MVKTLDSPIFDEQAEGFVIGSILQEPDYLAQVDLDPEDFNIQNYARLFEAMLTLKTRGEEISQATVIKEVSGKVESWVVDKVIAHSIPVDCLSHAATVKELSRKRHLLAAINSALQSYQKDNLSSAELADKLRLAIDTLTLPTKSSRAITVTNPRIKQADPPSYKLTVTSSNGETSAEIIMSSEDLDKSATFRRKVREKLQINPLLPKQYDAFVHFLVQQAVVDSEQADASADESTCYWIREWFTSSSEAEEVGDLAHGYIVRQGARWFSADRLLRFLADRPKVKLNRSELWSVISDRGGRKSKNMKIGKSVAKLWGLDEKFFKPGIVEDEQMALGKPGEEEDLSWLEEK
jgi:type II secretory pathway pseudopilin PulG